MRRIGFRILAVVAGSLIAIGGVAIACLAALDAWLGRNLAADDLTVHYLTSRPSIEARRLKIGNPPWTEPGTFAQIESVGMHFQWPGRALAWSIDSLRIEHARLTLTRDADEHTNWRLRDPTAVAGRGLPLIGSLALRDSRLQLHDQRRHLDFNGAVSIVTAAVCVGSQRQCQGFHRRGRRPRSARRDQQR